MSEIPFYPPPLDEPPASDIALEHIRELYEEYLGGRSSLSTLHDIGEILNELKAARG